MATITAFEMIKAAWRATGNKPVRVTLKEAVHGFEKGDVLLVAPPIGGGVMHERETKQVRAVYLCVGRGKRKLRGQWLRSRYVAVDVTKLAAPQQAAVYALYSDEPNVPAAWTPTKAETRALRASAKAVAA